jgi:hypothetical protein
MELVFWFLLFIAVIVILGVISRPRIARWADFNRVCRANHNMEGNQFIQSVVDKSPNLNCKTRLFTKFAKGGYFEDLPSTPGVIKTKLRKLIGFSKRNYRSVSGVINKIIQAFGVQYVSSPASVAQSCLLLDKHSKSSKLRQFYADLHPGALAPFNDVEAFMKKAKVQFEKNFRNDQLTEEEREFREKYDGVLLDFEAAVKLACLMAVTPNVGEPITVDSASKALLATMTKYGVDRVAFLNSFTKVVPRIQFQLPTKDCGRKIKLKISMDGRDLGGRTQVLVGIVVLVETATKVTHNPNFYIPLMLINTKESKELYDAITKYVKPKIENAKYFTESKTIASIEWYIFHFYLTFRYLSADLRSLWLLTGKSFRGMFCLWCISTPSNAGEFERWEKEITLNLAIAFGIPAERVVFCTLHATLRITERILLWLLIKSKENNTFDDVIKFIQTEANWKAFSVEENTKTGTLKISGWITGAKVARVISLRKKLIEVAFQTKKKTKAKLNPSKAPPKPTKISVLNKFQSLFTSNY